MIKEKYINRIKSIIESTRSDSQKINCLITEFDSYMGDIAREIESERIKMPTMAGDFFNRGLAVSAAIVRENRSEHHD